MSAVALLSRTSWEKAELSAVPFWGAPRLGQILPEETSTDQGSREESRGLSSDAGAALEQRVPCNPAASFRVSKERESGFPPSRLPVQLLSTKATPSQARRRGIEHWLLPNSLDT